MKVNIDKIHRRLTRLADRARDLKLEFKATQRRKVRELREKADRIESERVDKYIKANPNMSPMQAMFAARYSSKVAILSSRDSKLLKRVSR